MYIHNLNKYLVSQGHHVRVMYHGLKNAARENHLIKPGEISLPYIYEGVEVMDNVTHLDAYRWADVLVTHLDFTHFTLLLGNDIGKPVVHIVHNHHNYNSVENALSGVFVVYNSKWIADKLNYKWPSITIPPSIDAERFNVCEDPEKNEYITMINLNTNKGGRLLQKIARAFPKKKFLAVKGGYDEQILDQPSNVKVINNTTDILGVYKNTRVLLQPSQYESWGMTATEAMCSGIPVICTPTPGLKENCSYAGVYIDKRNDSFFDKDGNVIDDSDEYDLTSLIKAIKALDNKEYYRKKSEESRKRSLEHEPLKRMKDYEDFLYQAARARLKQYI
jgi:glycosyltransferase involved in cell wall biosynthesis